MRHYSVGKEKDDPLYHGHYAAGASGRLTHEGIYDTVLVQLGNNVGEQIRLCLTKDEALDFRDHLNAQIDRLTV